MMKEYTLNNNIKIPALGFGVWGLKGDVCKASVSNAIKTGYRLFDTASMYGNEKELGDAIKESGIDRKEFFITSKVWITEMGYNGTKKAFQRSLNRLGMEYMDLYLIHWPGLNISSTWKAMEELYDEKKIRSIGVSNFSIRQMDDLLRKAKVAPAVNQIKFNPYHQQKETLTYLRSKNILLEAYYPLGGQGGDLLEDERLRKIASQKGKSVPQILLRWDLQQDVITIPRSRNPDHIKNNFDVWDFELTQEEMDQISSIKKRWF